MARESIEPWRVAIEPHFHLNLDPRFILAFSLPALETNCYWLSLYCCRSFHFIHRSLTVFLPAPFENGTMVGASLCMTVISFYDVAMRGVFSLPWLPLCLASRFIALPCSGQLVRRNTSLPHPLLPLSSYTSTSYPLCTSTAGTLSGL